MGGIYYQNAYAASPKCAPSRAAFLTGRRSYQLEEAMLTGSFILAGYPTFMEVLAQSGYHVGYVREGYAPATQADDMVPRTSDPAVQPYRRIKDKELPSTLNPILMFENFIEFMADRPAVDTPFCVWMGSTEPHLPWTPNPERADPEKISAVNLPDVLRDTVSERQMMLDFAYEVEYQDDDLLRVLNHLSSTGELSNTLIIVTADQGTSIPYGKGHLSHMGLHVPLAVMWPGVIDGGRRCDEVFDLTHLARTILELAVVDVPDEIKGVSWHDYWLDNSEMTVPPSSVAVAGIERRSGDGSDVDILGSRSIREGDYLYIQSRIPEAVPFPTRIRSLDNVYPDRSWVGIEWLMHNQHEDKPITGLSGWTSRTLFEHIFGPRGEDRLFNVWDDPFCLDNLADNSAYSVILEQMKLSLDQELVAGQDPWVYGLADLFSAYPSGKQPEERFYDTAIHRVISQRLNGDEDGDGVSGWVELLVGRNPARKEESSDLLYTILNPDVGALAVRPPFFLKANPLLSDDLESWKVPELLSIENGEFNYDLRDLEPTPRFMKVEVEHLWGNALLLTPRKGDTGPDVSRN